MEFSVPEAKYDQLRQNVDEFLALAERDYVAEFGSPAIGETPLAAQYFKLCRMVGRAPTLTLEKPSGT